MVAEVVVALTTVENNVSVPVEPSNVSNELRVDAVDASKKSLPVPPARLFRPVVSVKVWLVEVVPPSDVDPDLVVVSNDEPTAAAEIETAVVPIAALPRVAAPRAETFNEVEPSAKATCVPLESSCAVIVATREPLLYTLTWLPEA